MSLRLAFRFTYLIVLLFATANASAQMPRERAVAGGPVEELFWAPTVISTASVTNLPRGNANFTIMHSFGPVSGGAGQLWGLDGAANIRFGLDYGITDRFSVGIGRSRLEKVVDFRTKVNLLRQTTDGRMPVEVAVKGDLGITTEENGFEFPDRLSSLVSVMVARRMSDKVSIQVTPMFSHFNAVVAQGGVVPEGNHYAVGLAGRYVISERVAILAEFVPVLGDRTEGTRDNLALGIDLETGGHVFQLFVATSHWLTEQHAIARNTGDFFDSDFRLGFNVNRVFGVAR